MSTTITAKPSVESAVSAGHRGNNFDLIRLAAAWLVIVGHSCVLRGVTAPTFFGMSVHSVGVHVFFVLSGYLIMQSWQRDPRLLAFLARRALRLFPALVLCMLVTVLVVGPLATTLPIEAYLSHAATWLHFKNLLLHIHYSLPGVFEGNPFGAAVNGSLWTLPVEAFAYLTLAILMLAGRGAGNVFFILGFGGFVVAGIWYRYVPPPEPLIVYATLVPPALNLLTSFAIGASAYLFRLDKWLDLPGAVFVVLALSIVAFPVHIAAMITLLAIAWLTLALGLHAPGYLRLPAKFGDLSYGMYLWAFPVQQTLVQQGWDGGRAWSNVWITTVVTLVLAWISWHLVEIRALRLKPRPPPRHTEGS